MISEDRLQRVLFVAREMEARGTNEYVSYLACELRRKGLETALFCAPGPLLEVLNQRGVPVSTFKHLAGVRFPHKQKAEFQEKLRDFSPDIVHAPGFRAFKTYNEIRGECRAPMVVTMHSAPPGGRLFRSLPPEISGIIATSQKVREEIVNDFYFPKKKTVMICNGIDVTSMDPGAADPVFSRRVPVIGSVGPAEQARGHELFIKAASILKGSGIEAQFVIAGEGGEVSRLSRLGSRFGLDKCLTFVRDFASYYEVLEALDVVVQSSRVDVSGFSILDAMGCARPVVAFNTGTACEIITDGRTGLIVPGYDAEALASVLAGLAENPEWGRKLGRQAREKVIEKFNISKTAESVMDFYRRILTSHD